MSIGLDLGSSEFRSLRSSGEQLLARRCPAVFTSLPDSAGHRKLLEQSQTRFATCADHLVLVGEAAVEWSAMLNLSLTPLLPEGRIPTSDTVSRQLLSLVLDSVLPKPQVPGSLCCMTVPGGTEDRRDQHDAEFFRQLVSLRGYRPQFVTATQALALAELGSASFSGLAISLGHMTSEFGIMQSGREIARFVVHNGMEGFAGAPQLGEHGESELPAGNPEREYQRFFKAIIAAAKAHFELDRTLTTMSPPMAVVCAGAVTAATAFLPLFQQAWNEAAWPVVTRPIQCATDTALVIARGCLIQSELDESSESRQAA